ncbi:MAG: lipopolysaccharide heptosyltransferase I [Gammaproteobacteria bacterium]|nr:lipopolysaccharide heptosyltransferase I [Gammaproteobacteria bacterium]
MRILLVKMSSLGDVVHTLPGLSDAAAALGDRGLTVDWVVEEAFAPIARRHPAVADVVPIAWRTWRRDLWDSRTALNTFRQRLRARHYDLILDAQGLLKSAAVTALARGSVTAGLSRQSAREPAAALFYQRRLAVPRGIHAVERIRRLFAAALNYPLPDAAPDFGIAPRNAAADQGAIPRCLLLHGTTWDSKHWPVRFWCDIAARAAGAGMEVVLPWGDATERQRAEAIAQGTAARVLSRQSLDELADTIATAALVIGVDSGLAHLSAALAVPTVVIYGATSSTLTGCRGARVHNLQADFPCSPCLSRQCTYRGPQQTWQGAAVVPACYSRVPPERVWQAATELAHADRFLHL